MSSSKQPRISVITIVRNARKDLETTIKNIDAQTYPHLEYIVVDGGSTDGTVNLIQEHEEQPVSNWISEPDSGTSEATNKGWQMATGDLVAYLNAGDWYESGTLEKVAQTWRQHPATVIHGNTSCWAEDGTPYCIYRPSSDFNQSVRINHPASFIPREIWQKTGGFDLDYSTANDFEFYLRLHHLGIPFFHLDDTLTNYELGGMSDKDWLRGYSEVRRAKVAHGESVFHSTLIFLITTGITAIRRLLEKFGLGRIVTWYRNRFASIRHYYDANPMLSPNSSNTTNAPHSSNPED